MSSSIFPAIRTEAIAPYRAVAHVASQHYLPTFGTIIGREVNPGFCIRLIMRYDAAPVRRHSGQAREFKDGLIYLSQDEVLPVPGVGAA